MSYFEIDPQPIDAIFGHQKPEWEREDSDRGAWRRVRRMNIPAEAKIVWTQAKPIETFTEEETEYNDGFDYTKITQISKRDQLSAPTTVNFKVADYIIDGRVLSNFRKPPKTYGQFVSRRLGVSYQWGHSLELPSGEWGLAKIEMSPGLKDLIFDEVISYGIGNIDDPRMFVENKETADRITHSLTTLRRLQLFQETY